MAWNFSFLEASLHWAFVNSVFFEVNTRAWWGTEAFWSSGNPIVGA